MKKNSKLIWELSLAWVAFAGGATLLVNFFPFIPVYVFGFLFVVGFILMLISFSMRIYENRNPVVIDLAALVIDTMDDVPSITITVGFNAREKTNINNHIFIEFPEELEAQLSQIASFEPLAMLREPEDNYNYIPIDMGQYLEFNIDFAFKLRSNYDKTAINNINFGKSKVRLRWSVIGQHNKYTKLDIIKI